MTTEGTDDGDRLRRMIRSSAWPVQALESVREVDLPARGSVLALFAPRPFIRLVR